MKWTLFPLLMLPGALAGAYDLQISIPGREPIVMTMEQLKSELPATQFTTELPWLPEGETATFRGFTVFDLIAHLKVTNIKSATFTALNDYKAAAPYDDLEHYKPIIAYSMDGEPMKIRDKGPFWLLYDLTRYPNIDTPDYHTKMVWQIKEISLSYHDITTE